MERYKKVAQKVGIMTWLDDAILQKKFENMNFEFSINDDLDFVVQISYKKIIKDAKDGEIAGFGGFLRKASTLRPNHGCEDKIIYLFIGRDQDLRIDERTKRKIVSTEINYLVGLFPARD